MKIQRDLLIGLIFESVESPRVGKVMEIYT